MIENAAWDPNYIPELLCELEPCRIYASDTDPSVFALVDYVDYQWALQWKWRAKLSKGGKKIYLCRKTSTYTAPTVRVQGNAWLHIEVMKRTGIIAPDMFHTIVDHRDGDGLNCRRANLRWATPSMNSKNVNGRYSHVEKF